MQTTVTDISGIVSQEIAGYDQKIQQAGFWGNVTDTLNANKDTLQAVLNDLLARKGFIEQSDVDKAWEAVKKARVAEMEAESKMYKRRFLLIGLGLVLVAAGTVAFIRYKNKKH